MKNSGIILVLFFSIQYATAQRASTTAYINKYKTIAIYEMKEHGIPASITLAQGLLESAEGKSELAQKARNHFGIKCTSDWTGGKFYHDDDKKNECFRKYKSDEESFEDHSLFLRNRKHYSALFNLDITDYKAWAKGLKNAGYATNPKYPELLIKIIEDNRLFELDSKSPSKNKKENNEKQSITINSSIDIKNNITEVFIINDTKYIEAKEGDTWQSIANRFGLWPSQLLRFNEVKESKKISSGQRIFLQPKRRKSFENCFKIDKIQMNLNQVSDKFAVKLKSLQKYNPNLSSQYPLEPGTMVNLKSKGCEKKVR